MTECEELFNDFNSLKVGVIGDVMLDTYIWGKVDRISPEAPVPIVSLHHKEQRIGGAGNVALNCSSLGAKVFMLGVIGDDEEAVQLEQLLKEACAQLDPSAHAPCTSTTFFALMGPADGAGAVCAPSDPARTPATSVSIRKMRINVLHLRLARFISKFAKSDGIVTERHADVTDYQTAKLQIRIAHKKTPRFPGAFSHSANTG